MAYFYSSVVVFRFLGEVVFFWELLTFIDIMLLGHWLEMCSVMGASKTFEELIKIMSSVAHLKKNDDIADVGIAIGAGTDVTIKTADIVLVLVKSDPRDVVDIIGLSRKTYSKMYQNLL